MLDHVVILHKCGLVIFLHTFASAASSAVSPSTNPQKQKDTVFATCSKFIETVLLTPSHSNTTTTSNKTTVINSYAIQHHTTPTQPIIVMGLYQEMLVADESMSYVTPLLSKLFRAACKWGESSVNSPYFCGEKSGMEVAFQREFKRVVDSKLDDQLDGDKTNGKHMTPTRKKLTKKQKELNALDFSSASSTPRSAGEINDDDAAVIEARKTFLPVDDDDDDDDNEEYSDDDDDDDVDVGPSPGSWAYSFKGLLSSVTGNQVLTAEDLKPQLIEMRDRLVAKNVAINIAQEIVDGVGDSLVGVKGERFSTVKSRVRVALETAVERILTPNTKVDLLRSVIRKRSMNNNKPYVIAFIGINGVGKSTSLAKVAYYLKKNGCNPLMAAGDTFRAGAVEQLGVHAKCLGVPIFKKGYGKDPSLVAKEAISQASKEGNDVVLIDTAGRMQNNVPLMNALGKLVVENQPDLVCFVGEALVGGDGISQLSMFNEGLKQGGHGRNIDGIVLTKFDTVSDKVGAALTMSHITGQPILFVGTGQKYNHLKKLSVQAVIRALFT